MYEHYNKCHTMSRIILIFTILQVINVFCQKESSTIENIFEQESEYNNSVLKIKAIKGESENVIKETENEIIRTVEPNSVSKVRSNTTTYYGEIYGGLACPAGEYKTVVSLRCAVDIHRCGGSLINELFVLSAADCYISSTGPYTVVAGINRCSDREKRESPVIEVHIHKMYEKGNPSHNIALFELKIPIRQNDYIEYVRLPLGRIRFQSGSKVLMKGWRPPKDFDMSKNDNLRCAASRLIDFDECMKYWPAIWRDKDTIFCALAKEELSMCIGDLGSSITYSGKQIGILTFGRQKVIGCSLPYPEVYTKIDYYLDWINRTVGGINARKSRGIKTNDPNSDC